MAQKEGESRRERDYKVSNMEMSLRTTPGSSDSGNEFIFVCCFILSPQKHLRIAEFAPSALHYTDVPRTYPDISINEVGEHRSSGVIYVKLHAIELYSMKWRIITGCEMH